MSAVADHALADPSQQTPITNINDPIITPTTDNYNNNTTGDILDNSNTNNNDNNIIIDENPFNIRHENGSTYITPRVINETWTELKVGVLLPFHQKADPWTERLTLSGASAIRMAVNEINSQQLLPDAYITLIERDSFPKDVDGQAGITQAVFSTVSLIQEGVIGVIGDISSSWTSLSALMTSTLQIPQCSFTAVATSLSDKTQYGYFFRTVPTKLLYADAALAFLVSQGWPSFGILYTDDDLGQQLSESLIMKSKLQGVHVQAYQKFYEDGPQSNIRGSIDILMSSGVQIVFVAAEGEAQLAAFTIAGNMGHINNNTVWAGMGRITDELYGAVQRFNTNVEKRTSSSPPPPPPQVNSNNKNKGNNTNTDAITLAAQTTPRPQPISFNETFAGGVFFFDSTLELHGYPPYDEFVDKWADLDSTM
ncbi:periplasmic binding protein-like I [Phascolomyces articulosus]|uniref:Periplasmic binding protein-like I n=1 Tax=Phascolomyces articulosus TaxID=60185 RepID=A0AAD5PHL4_9FUNG|nr:periplasmic binding protein-like I [Phascolomyces articulosus]